MQDQDIAPVQRKYVLTKIAKGDYLLPSNDGKRLLRLATYTEGPSSGLRELPRDRTLWGVWEWTGPFDMSTSLDEDDLANWDLWSVRAQWLDSRSAAIEIGLRARPRLSASR